jgi:transcriptional regulator with XRE-family HTH domain
MSKTEKIVFNRIKSVLAEKEKTNIELAKALKVAEVTVSSWCTNSAQPSLKRLYDIATFLNVDVRDLLKPNKLR